MRTGYWSGQGFLSAAVLIASLTGEAGSSYAACVVTTAPFYQCSGTGTTAQSINANNATVTTLPGFAVHTLTANALTIQGAGAVSFDDENAGILISNDLTALSVTSSGNIAAGNAGSVVLRANGMLDGAQYGIFARNSGSGVLKLTANGEVSASATPPAGENYAAIYAENHGTDLTLTTGVTSDLTGERFGIFANNAGTGTLFINANGQIEGNAGNGIAAYNYGSDLNIMTGATAHVASTANVAILARNYGSGGITLGIDSDISGATGGIDAANYGAAPTSITVSGKVIADTGAGIYASDLNAVTNVTVNAGGTVRSNGTGAGSRAIEIHGDGNVIVAGDVHGGTAGAILFDQSGTHTARLELRPGYSIEGIAAAGPELGDKLVLGGVGNGSFDLGLIGDTAQFRYFEDYAKSGAGNWTLTGTNSAIGNWSVDGGVLQVDGAMANANVSVRSTGTLTGLGTIGSLTAMSGGTVAPGDDSVGTLHVMNNVTFNHGSLLQVEVTGSGASDLIAAGGSATINGGTVQVLAGRYGYNNSTQYTILTAAHGRTGAFDKVTSDLAFLDPVLLYDGNSVYLNFVRNHVPLAAVATAPNQTAVAGGLATLPTDDPLSTSVLGLNAAGAQDAYDSLSGEIHASVQGSLLDESRYVREALLDRMLQADGGFGGGAIDTATFEPLKLAGDSYGDGLTVAPSPLTFWTRAFGGWGHFQGDGNAATLDRSLGGFVSGVDTEYAPGWRVGLAGGYTYSSFDVDQRYSSAQADSYHLAAYGGGAVGRVALRSGAVWTWNDINSTRTATLINLNERETASYTGDTGQLFGEAAYPIKLNAVAAEPFAGLALVHESTDSFTEHGGIAALHGSGGDQDVGYSSLGMRFATNYQLGGTTVTPHLSLAWQHAFGDITPDMGLAFAGTGPYTIQGVPIAQNSLLLQAGADFLVAPDLKLDLSYTGELASGAQDQGVEARFSWRF